MHLPDVGNGNDNLVHLLGFHKLGIQDIARPHDGDTVVLAAHIVLLVVDKGHDLIVRHAVLLQGVAGHHAGSTGTEDDDVALGTLAPEILVIDIKQDETGEEQQDGQQRVEHEDGPVTQKVVVGDDEGLVVDYVDGHADNGGNGTYRQ